MKYNFFVLTDKHEKVYSILLTDDLKEAQRLLMESIFRESDIDLIKWPSFGDFWNVYVKDQDKIIRSYILYRLVTNESLVINI